MTEFKERHILKFENLSEILRHIVIDRFCQILKFVAASPEAPSIAAVAQGLELPRATAYRLVGQFRDEGILEASEDGGLRLGSNFVSMVLSAATTSQVVQLFHSVTEAVGAAFEETGFLGRYTGSEVDLIHVTTPADSRRAHIHPGLGLRPVHACSSARAILAFLGENEIERLLARDFEHFTDRTVTDLDGVRAELAATRARGYAVCDEEIDVGVTSVAVPISAGGSGVALSVGVVGPRRRIAEHGIEAIGETLKTLVAGLPVAALGQAAPIVRHD
ncbi:MAG: IclR family transcriptional regulator [Hyphomicrobiales bacterium]|nr:MAG: IclR family transcriptional regulator [Hyphomicrobiales bacterium]